MLYRQHREPWEGDAASEASQPARLEPISEGEAQGLRPNFDPQRFAFLVRLWMAVEDIELTEVARRLQAKGYRACLKTLSRWYHGKIKRIPIEAPHAMAEVSGLPVAYWEGRAGLKVTENLGIAMVIESAATDSGFVIPLYACPLPVIDPTYEALEQNTTTPRRPKQSVTVHDFVKSIRRLSGSMA